jgi:hypothetical protein
MGSLFLAVRFDATFGHALEAGVVVALAPLGRDRIEDQHAVRDRSVRGFAQVMDGEKALRVATNRKAYSVGSAVSGKMSAIRVTKIAVVQKVAGGREAVMSGRGAGSGEAAAERKTLGVRPKRFGAAVSWEEIRAGHGADILIIFDF